MKDFYFFKKEPLISMSIKSHKETLLCVSLAVAYLCILLFSNAFANVLAVIFCIILIKKRKVDYVEWPNELVYMVQLSYCVLALICVRFKALYWQGFFDGFDLLYYFSNNLMDENNPFFFIMPICLATLLLMERKYVLAIFFVFCSYFYSIIFLPIIGLSIYFKIRKFIVLYLLFWAVEFTVTEKMLLQLPPWAQWLDILFLFGFLAIYFAKKKIDEKRQNV